jgi:ubiquinone/menaquinone biosynthesis C-methylase UbiE
MAEPERWQVSTDAAEVYESCFVPAIFGAWASPVADAAGIRRGNKVLDVGCGTGVLALPSSPASVRGEVMRYKPGPNQRLDALL